MRAEANPDLYMCREIWLRDVTSLVVPQEIEHKSTVLKFSAHLYVLLLSHRNRFGVFRKGPLAATDRLTD